MWYFYIKGIRNRHILKWLAWLDFLKALVVIQWYLLRRKNASISILLFRELYKSFYQEKWISWMSSVEYWTVANVLNKSWNLLKANSRNCVSLLTTYNMSKPFCKCFSGVLWTFLCLLWWVFFTIFTISFLMSFLKIFNRFCPLVHSFCYQL